MKKFVFTIIILIAQLGFAGLFNEVSACSCVPPSINSFIEKSDYIFIAEIKGTGKEDGYVLHIDIQEVLKGDIDESTTKVFGRGTTYSNTAACQRGYEEGGIYLMHGNRTESGLISVSGSTCDSLTSQRNGEYSDFFDEHLKDVRMILKGMNQANPMVSKSANNATIYLLIGFILGIIVIALARNKVMRKHIHANRTNSQNS